MLNDPKIMPIFIGTSSLTVLPDLKAVLYLKLDIYVKNELLTGLQYDWLKSGY